MQLFQNVSFEQLMRMLMLKLEIELTLTTYDAKVDYKLWDNFSIITN